MINTLYLLKIEIVLASSLILLISSTELFEAASNSKKGILFFAFSQKGQQPHCSPLFLTAFSQFNTFAKIRAVEVFPVPRGP